jgi:photosystem II stability/assembly factor-like uncharacterized protein
VGSGGVILKTTNSSSTGGQDWVQIGPGPSGIPVNAWQRLDALNEMVVCAGGEGCKEHSMADGYAAVSCSYDGRNTWKRLGDLDQFAGEHVIDVSLINPQTLYILGVTAFNRQLAFAVGQAWNPGPGQNRGVILYTGDGGRTWLEITPPVEAIDASLRRVMFVGARR